MKSKTIKVDYLARVEGEGALYVKVKDGAVEDVRLEIFEPPRFFEALLRGRDFTEAPDITARICGICPIAYLLGASRAMEDACGVEVGGPLDLLRRLIYCGEWIESHALHLFMLHAPDFLGYQDAVRMAHGFGLDNSVELARALDRLPGRLIVIGVEGDDFSRGSGLSSAVEGAVERAVEAVMKEIGRLATPGLRRGEAEHA